MAETTTEVPVQQQAQQTTEEKPLFPKEEVPELKPDQDFQGHKEARKHGRGERGGLRQRLKQMTKDTESAVEAARMAAEAATKAAKAAEATKTVVESRPADAKTFTEVEPKKEDFLTSEDPVEEYAKAKAEWTRKKDRFEMVNPPAKVETKKEELPPPVQTEIPAEFKKKADQMVERFDRNRIEFEKIHPDWRQSLEQAGQRGLNLSDSQQAVILSQENGPEVAYWLSRPENETKAREIMAMHPIEANQELARLSMRLERDPADYVSQAPPPVPRLNGGSPRNTLPLDSKQLSMQDYIRLRKEQKRGRVGR